MALSISFFGNLLTKTKVYVLFPTGPRPLVFERREEADMATGAGADSRNPSHRGKVAGGLWWSRAPDLAAWEGTAVRWDLGLCFA